MTAAARSEWAALHVHYCEDQTGLICDAIGPLVHGLLARNKIDCFFFIRYFDGGPHVRLRMASAPQDVTDTLEEARGFLTTYLERHPASSVETMLINKAVMISGRPRDDASQYPNNKVISAKYEPEIERYGGPKGLPLSEHLFFRSSLLALKLLAHTRASPKSMVGAAAETMLAGVAAVCGNLHIAIEFLRQYYTTALAGAGPAVQDWVDENTTRRVQWGAL